MISTVGIDLDSKAEHDLERMLIRAALVGEVLWCRESGRGYHARIRLHKPCGILESLIVRFGVGDDPIRIIFDLRRIVAGLEGSIDILFDSKTRYTLDTQGN